MIVKLLNYFIGSVFIGIIVLIIMTILHLFAIYGRKIK